MCYIDFSNYYLETPFHAHGTSTIHSDISRRFLFKCLLKTKFPGNVEFAVNKSTIKNELRKRLLYERFGDQRVRTLILSGDET